MLGHRPHRKGVVKRVKTFKRFKRVKASPCFQSGHRGSAAPFDSIARKVKRLFGHLGGGGHR